MLDISFRNKALILAALFLFSSSIIFLRLGFTYLTLFGEKQGYLMTLVAPVAITSFLLGTPWGIAQALLSGTVLYVHSIVQPLDEVEYFLLTPAVDIVPLFLAALVYGALFFLLIKEDSRGFKRIVYLAVACTWGTLAFAFFFNLAVSLKAAGMDLSTALDVMSSSDWLVNPMADLIEVLLVFGLVAVIDLLIRRTLAAGRNVPMRVVFGARLYLLLGLTFIVLVAIGFTIITAQDMRRAKDEMNALFDFLSTQLGTTEESSDGIIDGRDFMYAFGDWEGNALVLTDAEGEVLASNTATFREGQNLTEIYNPGFMDTVKDISKDASLVSTYLPKENYEQSDGPEFKDHPERAWTLGYMCTRRVGDSYLVCIMTSAFVHDNRLTAINLAVLLAGVSGILSLLFTSKLLRSIVVRPLDSTNESLAKITAGNLGEAVQIQTSSEFVTLSSYINDTVESLKEYAAESERRIEQDLETAKVIQESVLPRRFPAFPGIDAFDIYASMCAAKYVGGDFYDLFIIGRHKLGFLIADVSGKGIPAALFMMRAKAHIATCMHTDSDLAQAVRDTNVHLCEGNNTFMFVTLWAATFDWETGELVYVNGGHDVPLLRHNGEWSWLKGMGGPFLGAANFSTYKSTTTTLDHGDALLLYTDGVTEAMDSDFNEYGKERLFEFVQRNADLHPRELDDAIRHDLQGWADGAEQSDDITMLTLEYR